MDSLPVSVGEGLYQVGQGVETMIPLMTGPKISLTGERELIEINAP